MSDLMELGAVGAGSSLVGGLVVGLLKLSGSRNISALDDTLKSLKVSTDALAKEVQALREAHIGLAKDIGALNHRLSEQDREISSLRRQVRRWGNFMQRIVLRTATGGEQVKIELPTEGDDVE